MLTPLLTISKAMRCTRCGARKGMLLAGAAQYASGVKRVEGRPACGLTGPHQQTRTVNTGPLFSQLTGSSGEIVTI